MDYFAGLDISKDETHVWVLDREGVVVRERAGRPTRRSNRSPLTRPIATTREVWRIWLALVSSSPCMSSRCRLMRSAL
jgi:hypothetical protein